MCTLAYRGLRVHCPVFLTNLEGKVGKVGKVGRVGKVGKEGRLRE
jgi:hypothetical protein